ncbi:sugar transferase [Spirosoma fluviale]|uniref:Putative colanic acid biosysnthesis UDP-glucose lipid carrier transferase n=1 Tax=Spirosoma fluviale TaxID=1597977 RepID=A0A286F6Q5_9BACT|nr:sugar transferase [Spirosoma fluviale]SOD78863.1 putative colanic acid biosysnthesis UDP-glucose lipid carrier transferase [Spirosoma fluviale]
MVSNALDPHRIKTRVRQPFTDAGNTYRWKRLFDLVIASLVMLFILSWLIPLISLFIILTSRGPAIFRQTRSGLHGQHFTCYKFRTMQWPNSDGPFRQASKDDTRVTGLGKFLRRTNLDETPQFINVLLGDMSIVGPRPHPIQLDAQFWLSLPGYSHRYKVRPGITGLAQARGCRGETGNPLKMKHRLMYDQFYIRKASIKLDVSICLHTLVTMLKGNTDAF